MGKASSAKKVARAAGLGGTRAYASRPAYGYYLSVAILLILGVVGVYNSREYLDGKTNAAGKFAPKVHQSPPWYEGFAIDECGKVLANIKTTKNPYGLTTHGDGVITISPTELSAAGHNATLGKFASAIGLKLNAGELQVPGGKLYSDGQTCEGKAGHVYVDVWTSPAAPQSDGTVQTKKNSLDTCSPDCDSGVLLKNDQLLTVAFLPAGPDNQPPTNIPLPPKSVISNLNNLLSSSGSTTTTSSPTSSTAPTTTTATGKTSTTKASGKTSTPTTTAKPTTTTSKSTTSTAKTTTSGPTTTSGESTTSGTKTKKAASS